MVMLLVCLVFLKIPSSLLFQVLRFSLTSLAVAALDPIHVISSVFHDVRYNDAFADCSFCCFRFVFLRHCYNGKVLPLLLCYGWLYDLPRTSFHVLAAETSDLSLRCTPYGFLLGQSIDFYPFLHWLSWLDYGYGGQTGAILVWTIWSPSTIPVGFVFRSVYFLLLTLPKCSCAGSQLSRVLVVQ